jgi:hypothetical protein
VDLELPRLPVNADIQALWGGFYEQLARPDDALVRWSQVIALDPKREPAHFAIATIYRNKSLWERLWQLRKQDFWPMTSPCA